MSGHLFTKGKHEEVTCQEYAGLEETLRCAFEERCTAIKSSFPGNPQGSLLLRKVVPMDVWRTWAEYVK